MSSSWQPAFSSLDDSLTLLSASLEQLKAAIPVDVPAFVEQLSMAAESAQNLRSFVASVLPDASWQSRDELDALLGKAQRISYSRSRLEALASELERGGIVHRRALRVNQLNQLRDQAINQLRSQAGTGGELPTLPGPEASQWIEWACGLKEPDDAEPLQTLRDSFAHLDTFVANLEPCMWRIQIDTSV